MKKVVLSGMLVLLSLGFYAARTAEQEAVGVLKQLGISEDAARDSIWSSLAGGYVSFPSLAGVRKLPVSQRAALVPTLGSFARQYTESQEFLDKYLAWRMDQKPEAPEAPPSSSQRREEMKKQLQESLQSAEATMRSMPADQQAMFKESIDYLKQQLKELDDPNNPLFSSDMDAYSRQAHEADMADYRNKLAQWEADYPASPDPLIRRSLEQFLQESEGVDYSARLKPGNGGKMVFVDPSYEAKPGNWKLCYRAGRETMEAARSFARSWLADLQKAN